MRAELANGRLPVYFAPVALQVTTHLNYTGYTILNYHLQKGGSLIII